MNAVTVSRSTRADGGFTLVEVVVATALVTLVAGLVLVTYLLAARQVARWQDRLTVENTFHVMQNRIADDLRRAERVVWAEGTATGEGTASSEDTTPNEREELGIVGSDSSRVVYVLRDSVLLRNGRPMHGSELRVSSFDAVLQRNGVRQGRDPEHDSSSSGMSLPGAASPGAGGFEGTAPESFRNHHVYAEVRLGLIHQGKVSRVVISAYLRKPSRWTPVRPLRSQ